MAVQMPKLERDKKSGNWVSRQVIPADVRAVLGKREFKQTWPATFTQSEATCAYHKWHSDLTRQIAAARKGGDRLTDEQVKDVAGRWFAEQAHAQENRNEHPEALEAVLTVLAEADRHPYVREQIEKSARALLKAQSIIADRDTVARLTAEMLHLYTALYSLKQRQQEGNFRGSPLAHAAAHATPSPGPSSSASAANRPAPSRLRLLQLFERWAAHPEQRDNASGTLQRYRGAIKAISRALDNPLAEAVTMERLRDHMEQRMEEGLAPRTAKATYRAVVSSIYGWGKGKGLISNNPAVGWTIKVRRRGHPREKGFRDDEAQRILNAARATPSSNRYPTLAAAKQWVPFLCAYTGARVGEMTQIRAEDVQEHGGGWFIRITPEAGKVKDREERFVPLHSRLIELGFVTFAKARREGPLFYTPNASGDKTSASTRADSRAEDLAKWVRKEIGITDANVAPNHAWRHRFKTCARRAGIEEQYADAITGHAPRSVGRQYGDRHDKATLLREIGKLTVEAVEGKAEAGREREPVAPDPRQVSPMPPP